MNVRSSLSFVSLLVGTSLTAAAVGQTSEPAGTSPRSEARADAIPTFDPAQLPSFTGKVQQFTLTPHGDIDGLILSDGTEVRTPPHLSTSIAYAIKPGDAVTIHGLRAAAIPLVQAASITDQVSGRSIVDSGPGPLSRPATAATAAGASVVQGTIRMSLHGPRGEINGLLLSDGTVLRLPPESFTRVGSVLQTGKQIVAEGDELSNSVGKVMAVRAIGSSRTELVSVDDPPPARGRPGPVGPDAGRVPPPPVR